MIVEVWVCFECSFYVRFWKTMYFLNMFYNIITRFLTSFTHVFHKKRKGQVVQKSASSRIRLWWKRL